MTHKSSDNLRNNANTKEVFLPITGYEQNYTISNYGKVYSFNQKRPSGKGFMESRYLKYKNNGTGYLYISLYKDGKVNNFLIHRLIAIHFIPNPNNYAVINHIDGNKQNNSVVNLEWCTQSHNLKHALLNGLRVPVKGESVGLAKLTELQVLEIRRIYSLGGISQSQLAKDFNVGHSSVGYIINRKTWKHI